MTDESKYHAIPARIIVKPVGADIFDETATIVEIEDEAAGPFVKVSQPGSDHENACIAIEGPEWPLIRDAIQQLLGVVKRLDADTRSASAGTNCYASAHQQGNYDGKLSRPRPAT